MVNRGSTNLKLPSRRQLHISKAELKSGRRSDVTCSTGDSLQFDRHWLSFSSLHTCILKLATRHEQALISLILEAADQGLLLPLT
eukprot:12597-Eustigmatos_ZCMA.PRE.1